MFYIFIYNKALCNGFSFNFESLKLFVFENGFIIYFVCLVELYIEDFIEDDVLFIYFYCFFNVTCCFNNSSFYFLTLK